MKNAVVLGVGLVLLIHPGLAADAETSLSAGYLAARSRSQKTLPVNSTRGLTGRLRRW